MRGAALSLACAVVLGGAGLTACGDESAGGSSGSEGPGNAEEQEVSGAADQGTCLADAEEVGVPYAADFPDAWIFPPATTVYHVEDRAETGVIVTGVSGADFEDVLDFLNENEVDAGFQITEGETEEDDAEANWATESGQLGRWTIQRSVQCPGEIVIQVLAQPAP